MSSLLERSLVGLPEPDSSAHDAASRRAGQVIRPPGALARLDEVAIWLAGWQGTDQPRIAQPALIVAAASHGVCAEGVSAYPSEVTAAMDAALRSGVATASVLAQQVGAGVTILDVGVHEPTANLVVEDAMTLERFDDATTAGFDAVNDQIDAGADLIVLGEMGIGNTTAAAAVAAGLYDGTGDQWCGRGTGVDDAGLARKIAAVDAGLARVRRSGPTGPLDILRRLGGLELAAVAGGIVAARRRRTAVILDGFIITAAGAALDVERHGALDHCIAGHCSAEPGHRRLLDLLGRSPLLQLDLRLGEGSGALLAVPLVRAAAAALSDVATFDQIGMR